MIDRSRLHRWGPFLALVPGLLLFAAILYPFLTGVYWAFSDVGPRGVAEFIGLDNFVEMFQPGRAGFQGLWTTIVFATAAVSTQILIGFGVALLLTYPARWVRPFRVLVIIPLLLPPVVATIMWRVMLVDRGVINAFVETLGFDRINFLGAPTSAFWTVVIIESWLFTPFVILILLAGLQSIPEEIAEAARVDGASTWGTIRRIYIPLMRPFFIIVIVFRGIDSLKSFEVIWTATQGGPLDVLKNLHVHGYQYAIQYLRFGQSMSMLFVLWVLIWLISFFLLRRRREAATGS